MENNEFGSIIKRQRQINEMTQQGVADRLGIDRTTYAKYESGKANPNFNTVIKLASIFGVNVSELSVKEKAASLGFADSAALSAEEARLLYYFRALSERRKQEVMRSVNRLTFDQEKENDIELGDEASENES